MTPLRYGGISGVVFVTIILGPLAKYVTIASVASLVTDFAAESKRMKCS
jgi:hypothetical protein